MTDLVEKKAVPEKPAPKPIASGSVYIGLCNMRNGEAQLRWQRAQLGIALNLSTLVGATYRLLTFPAWQELIFLAVGATIVALLDVLWLTLLVRGARFLNFWNDKIEELERVDGVEGGIKIFSSKRYRRMRSERVRFHSGLQVLALGCIVLWGLVMLASLILLRAHS